MDSLQPLGEYFKTFVGYEKPRDFFLGLADYLDYANTLPEFNFIVKKFSREGTLLLEKRASLEKNALIKVEDVKKELEKYVLKQKIKNQNIRNALNEYANKRERRPLENLCLPLSLLNKVDRVIETLYRMPKHKRCAKRYIEFLDEEKTKPNRFSSIKEIDELIEINIEIEHGYKFDLWGQWAEIQCLHEIIRKSKERRGELLRKYYANPNPTKHWQLLNFIGVASEWEKIKSGEIDQDAVCFEVEKIGPWVRRLHNHVLARFAEANTALASKIVGTNVGVPESKTGDIKLRPKLLPIGKKGYLKFYKEGKRILIGKINTRKYRLVAALSDPFFVAKKIRVVFDAIRIPKDKEDVQLKGGYSAEKRMREIIKNTLKELQKVKGLRGRIYLMYPHEDSVSLNFK